MTTHSAPASVDSQFQAYHALNAPVAKAKQAKAPATGKRASLAPYIAFFITVFASMAAAAAVLSTEAPLMVVGLY